MLLISRRDSLFSRTQGQKAKIYHVNSYFSFISCLVYNGTEAATTGGFSAFYNKTINIPSQKDIFCRRESKLDDNLLLFCVCVLLLLGPISRAACICCIYVCLYEQKKAASVPLSLSYVITSEKKVARRLCCCSHPSSFFCAALPCRFYAGS